MGEDDPAGHVLAVSSWGYPDAPIAGGKKLSRLRNLGLAGLVADARLRDFEEVEELGIAAWCRGETVRQGGEAIMPFAANVPVGLVRRHRVPRRLDLRRRLGAPS